MIRLDNDYYVNDLVFSRSLMRFFVSIEPIILGDKIIIKMTIIDCDRRRIFLRFNSYEEAFDFTQDVIKHCDDIDEILEHYFNGRNKKSLSLK